MVQTLLFMEFDGCMYGLKSQFKDAGMAIKKPWRIVSWGVSFFDLHEKCDGSHPHGPCAGRETRATQLYTDKIVRCIIRGVKNQMLWNIAEGDKATKESQEQTEHSETKEQSIAHAYPLLMMRMNTKRTSILTNFYSIGFAAEVV